MLATACTKGGDHVEPTPAMTAMTLDVGANVTLTTGTTTTIHARIGRGGFTGVLHVGSPWYPLGSNVPALELAGDQSEVDVPITVSAEAPQARTTIIFRVEGDGVAPQSVEVPTLVRGPSGILDRTRNGSGFFPADLGHGAMDEQGRVYVAASQGGTLARHLPTGELDASFGEGGRVQIGGQNAQIAIANGKIAMAGTSIDAVSRQHIGCYYPQTHSRLWVERRNADGSVDPTFHGGKSFELDAYPVDVTYCGSDGTEPIAIAIDDAGIVRVLFRNLGSPAGDRALRFTANGEVAVQSAPMNRSGSGSVGVLLPNGEGRIAFAIPAASSSDAGHIGYGGFTADGAIDLRFGPEGWRTGPEPAAGVSASPNGIAIYDRDNAILFGAFQRASDEPRGALARAGTDGSWQFPLGGDGPTVADFAWRPSRFDSVARTPAGQILATGHYLDDPAVMRFDAAGKPDLTFGRRGIAVIPLRLMDNLGDITEIFPFGDGALVHDGAFFGRIWL